MVHFYSPLDEKELSFAQLDEFQTYDYVMTIVDGLSRFSRFFSVSEDSHGRKGVQDFFRRLDPSVRKAKGSGK